MIPVVVVTVVVVVFVQPGIVAIGGGIATTAAAVQTFTGSTRPRCCSSFRTGRTLQTTIVAGTIRVVVAGIVFVAVSLLPAPKQTSAAAGSGERLNFLVQFSLSD